MNRCFFQLDLPKYSSLDIMYDKFLFAITHCVAVGESAFVIRS